MEGHKDQGSMTKFVNGKEVDRPVETAEEKAARRKAEKEKKKLKKQGDGRGKETQPQPSKEEASGESKQKSKSQQRAERRALQEAQRAAKGDKKKGEEKPQPQIRVADTDRVDVAESKKRFAKQLEKQQVPQRKSVMKKVRLFSHLVQYETDEDLTACIPLNNSHLHPAVVRLGLQYSSGKICGSNARCVALLGAMKQVIVDYSTPADKDLSRDLDAKLKPYIAFLRQCRPLSVSMGSAIKYIKYRISQIPGTMPENEAKQQLTEAIDDFYRYRVQLAGQAIANASISKIEDGDVVLVYAYSSLLLRALCAAHDSCEKRGWRFKVLIADGRPRNEGRVMLRRLIQHGLDVSYVNITAVPHCMSEVTKVFLGAHGILANGHVMSRVGSAQIAIIAKSWCVPVMVCCETYKFTERVMTDSFVSNELGNPSDLVEKDGPLRDWQNIDNLYLLNLGYDVTPPELVSLVITEHGMLPSTSVPVVLRVRPVEMNY